MASNTCMICGNTLEGVIFSDIRGNRVCGTHGKNLKYCNSCGGFVRESDLHLADGRILCSLCSQALVRHPEDVKWIIVQVKRFLFESGITDLSDTINLMIVTAQEMCKVRGDEKINLGSPGLALSKCGNCGLFKKRWEHTVYVLDNIPKVEFAGVLAHELLHTWQNEKEYDFPADLKEGFCNLGSYVTYLKIGNDYSRILAENLKNDPNEIYGGGFRKVLPIYQRVGNLHEVAEIIGRGRIK